MNKKVITLVGVFIAAICAVITVTQTHAMNPQLTAPISVVQPAAVFDWNTYNSRQTVDASVLQNGEGGIKAGN